MNQFEDPLYFSAPEADFSDAAGYGSDAWPAEVRAWLQDDDAPLEPVFEELMVGPLDLAAFLLSTPVRESAGSKRARTAEASPPPPPTRRSARIASNERTPTRPLRLDGGFDDEGPINRRVDRFLLSLEEMVAMAAR